MQDDVLLLIHLGLTMLDCAGRFLLHNQPGIQRDIPNLLLSEASSTQCDFPHRGRPCRLLTQPVRETPPLV